MANVNANELLFVLLAAVPVGPTDAGIWRPERPKLTAARQSQIIGSAGRPFAPVSGGQGKHARLEEQEQQQHLLGRFFSKKGANFASFYSISLLRLFQF